MKIQTFKTTLNMIQQQQSLTFRTGYKKAFICHPSGNISIGKIPVYEKFQITKKS